MLGLWRNHPWRLRVAALALSAAAVALLRLWAPQVLSGAEQMAGDLAWRIGASSAPERRFVVVDIDEASLRDVGPWPWPRSTLAQLSQRLAQAGALVQAYDISFSDAKEGDAQLLQAWSQAAVVGAQIFSLDPSVTPHAGLPAGALAQGGCPPFAPRSHGFYGTAEELLRARPAMGHITPRVERDGVVRKLPALVCHEGRAYPSLALATFWRAAQAETSGPRPRPLPAPDWLWHSQRDEAFAGAGPAPVAWLTSRSLPGLIVPLDEHGDMLIPYRLDRKAFASLSAAEVLRGSADSALLKGTIVLIGATAFGIGDTVATPHSAVASGVEVHAQALAGLLDHRLPYLPAQSSLWQVLAIVAIGAALWALAVRRRGVPAKRLPLLGLGLAAACWLGASFALVSSDLYLPWAGAALFAALGSVSLATVEHALARAQRERLSAHLGAYLPAPVAQRLMATDPSGTVQVDQRDVSVLVADIRNFSAFAAHRPAEETAAMLHAFCCIAVDVVEQHGGVVENVVGDSILAVWNAYSECDDHPKQAMAAAKELVRATRQLLTSNRPTAEHSPVQPLALGVGVETGTAIVGSFGPARRRAHAALGEPVSVANRIQHMTLDLSMPILVGPQLAARLPAAATEPMGEYLLEGLSKHYSLFVPTAWAELVPSDPQWVNAATAGERPAETSGWSRWAESSTTGTLPRGPAVSLRDA